MRFFRGFLMAWGNFSAIPCPYHKWHEESRKAMLCMLPLVGLLLAAVVVLLWSVLDMAGVSPIMTGVLLTVIYFISNGFIHLDGFMDCSDALLSRRPELEERQRILKASDVGAFAVISLVMVFMVYAASLITIAADFSIQKAVLLPLITVVSRGTAAYFVGKKAPMKTSQYADLPKRRFGAAESFVLCLSALLPVAAAFAVCVMQEGGIAGMISCAVTLFAVLFTAIIAGGTAVKKLGGMSGDIAGYMIVTGEAAAAAAAAIAISCLGI